VERFAGSGLAHAAAGLRINVVPASFLVLYLSSEVVRESLAIMRKGLLVLPAVRSVPDHPAVLAAALIRAVALLDDRGGNVR